MVRNDIQGVERPPKSIATYLHLKGGENIYGEPNYRLVWGPSRMRQRGGRYQDWDKERTAQERGGLITLESGLVIPSIYKPQRVVVEIRTVRKYAAYPDGWVMERWVPVAYYGSESEWYSRCVPGTSVPFGGQFPTLGDYEICHYSPSVDLPTISQLQTAIDRCERSRDKRHTDVAQLVLERVNEAEAEYEAQLKAESEERIAFMKDVMSPFHRFTLTAGALRTKAAERAGIYTHEGN